MTPALLLGALVALVLIGFGILRLVGAKRDLVDGVLLIGTGLIILLNAWLLSLLPPR